MTKQEVKDLLIQIKVFYPRFESVEKDGARYGVMTATVDSWYNRLGYMEYAEAIRILNSYMETDDGRKTPNIQLWLNGGKKQEPVWHNATFKNGMITWQPEKNGVVYEIRAEWNGKRQCIEDEDGRLWATADDVVEDRTPMDLTELEIKHRSAMWRSDIRELAGKWNRSVEFEEDKE